MDHVARDRTIIALAVAASLLLAGCGGATATSSAGSPSPTAPGSPAGSAAPVSSTAPGSTTPTATTTGFVFAADDIAAYYQGQGYACGAPAPSTSVAGFMVRTCQLVDDAGRTLVVGLVTDPTGVLADGFASVKGKPSETVLAPIDALYPLSGFLGAALGETQGGALVAWLASHLGDARAQTTSGPLTVVTHTESPEDHATLYVEVSSPAYLAASGGATPSP